MLLFLFKLNLLWCNISGWRVSGSQAVICDHGSSRNLMTYLTYDPWSTDSSGLHNVPSHTSHCCTVTQEYAKEQLARMCSGGDPRNWRSLQREHGTDSSCRRRAQGHRSRHLQHRERRRSAAEWAVTDCQLAGQSLRTATWWRTLRLSDATRSALQFVNTPHRPPLVSFKVFSLCLPKF